MSRKDKNVFRELEILRLETDLAFKKDYLPDSSIQAQLELLHRKREVISEIKKYLESYKWLKHKRTIERVKAFHESGFNYAQACEILNEPNVNSYETSIWYTAKKFKEAIGESTVKLIAEDRPEEAMRQFRIRTGQLDLTSLIAKDTVTLIPKPMQVEGLIHTSECKRELKVLKQMTLKYTESIISKLEESKLSFLRYVMEETDPAYSTQRALIYDFLENGNIEDLETLIQELKLEEINP